MSLEYYEMAIKKAKEGSKREAVKLYTRTFFIRCADNFQDLVFCDFFALQFLKYIKTNLNKIILVKELIKMLY